MAPRMAKSFKWKTWQIPNDRRHGIRRTPSGAAETNLRRVSLSRFSFPGKPRTAGVDCERNVSCESSARGLRFRSYSRPQSFLRTTRRQKIAAPTCAGSNCVFGDVPAGARASGRRLWWI